MNLAMLLDIAASIAPDATALIGAGGGPDGAGASVSTYASLREAAGRVAALLAQLGVGAGDRVGVFATNCAEYVEVLFGTAACGAVSVPMNCRARPAELDHLVRDSGAKVLFSQARYGAAVAEVAGGAEVVLFDGDYRERVGGAEPSVDVADVGDGDLALLLYTSGTTALPKGVMLTHGGLTGYVMNRTECADGTDRGRTLLAAPLHHVAAVSSLVSSVYSGRTVVVLPQFDAAAWLDAVARHRVTHAFVVPTMLARLVAEQQETPRDLSSLELVTYGAAPMPPSVIRRALDEFPVSVSFSGAYGQTETTSTVAVLGPDDHRLEGDPGEVAAKVRRLASVGRPVDDVELRVVGDDGRPLPVGAVGEVQIRTPRTMSGYWGSRAGATTATLDAEGWVHTGDMGHLDADGYLFLGGRAGDLIIRGGENIAPEEIEAALYEHPDVAEAGVVGVADEEWGEQVVAAVVARPGSTLTEPDVAAFCAERLPGYKRPRRIVVVEALPRTSTGKLVRRDLVPLFAART